MMNLIILLLAYAGSIALARQVLKSYLNRYYEAWRLGWIKRYSPMAWTVFAVTRQSYSRGESHQEAATWLLAVIWPVPLVFELIGQIIFRPIRHFISYDSRLAKIWLFTYA